MPEDAPEQDQRWQEFCRRLDELQQQIEQLSGLVAGLHELGNLILLGLQDAVAAGAGSPFLDVIQRLIRAFRGE